MADSSLFVGPLSPEERLGRIITTYAGSVVYGWITMVAAAHTPAVFRGELGEELVLGFGEYFINGCVELIHTRTDPAINSKYDEMIAAGVPYHRIDLLELVMKACLAIVHEIDWVDDVAKMKVQIAQLTDRDIRSELTGCTRTHDPIPRGVKMWVFDKEYLPGRKPRE